MNRYDIPNAVHRIDGYFIPDPHKTPEERFEKAKKECLHFMEQDLAVTRGITWEQFKSEKRDSSEIKE